MCPSLTLLPPANQNKTCSKALKCIHCNLNLTHNIQYSEVLTWYPATLLNLCIRSATSLVESLGFSTHRILSSANTIVLPSWFLFFPSSLVQLGKKALMSSLRTHIVFSHFCTLSFSIHVHSLLLFLLVIEV